MGLAGRPVVLFDPEMEFDPAIAKPGATAVDQGGGLGQFLATERIAVELPRLSLGFGRDGELHMMEEPRHGVERSDAGRPRCNRRSLMKPRSVMRVMARPRIGLRRLVEYPGWPDTATQGDLPRCWGFSKNDSIDPGRVVEPESGRMIRFD